MLEWNIQSVSMSHLTIGKIRKVLGAGLILVAIFSVLAGVALIAGRNARQANFRVFENRLRVAGAILVGVDYSACEIAMVDMRNSNRTLIQIMDSNELFSGFHIETLIVAHDDHVESITKWNDGWKRIGEIVNNDSGTHEKRERFKENPMNNVDSKE